MIILLFVLIAVLYIGMIYIYFKLDKTTNLIYNLMDQIIKKENHNLTEEQIQKFIENLF